MSGINGNHCAFLLLRIFTLTNLASGRAGSPPRQVCLWSEGILSLSQRIEPTDRISPKRVDNPVETLSKTPSFRQGHYLWTTLHTVWAALLF
jgi:hypothetical protein